MRARYVSGSGEEGTAAVLEVDGAQYECMDCLGYGRARSCKPGEIVNVQFCAGLLESEGDSATIGKNEREFKGLERLRSWRYRAYGVVIRDGADARLDCGVFELELDLSHADPAPVVGAFIAVGVDRLECWRTKN